MAVSAKEVADWRDTLDREKEKVPGRAGFPPEVRRELDELENELAGYGFERDFAADILRQIADSLVRCDGSDQLRLRFARSTIKGVKSGDQMEMLLAVQMIGGHVATMNLTARMNATKDVDECESYGNLSNKFARTFVDQLGMLHRLRSGPQHNLTVHNVSVSDGGQAIVGHITHNSADKGQPRTAEPQRLVTNQSGTAMPIIETEDKAVTTVPAVEQEPAAIKTKRGRRK